LSIDYALERCSEIVDRDLTKEETLLVGIAFSLGFVYGLKKGLKDGEK
jgi:hypothetical protein